MLDSIPGFGGGGGSGGGGSSAQASNSFVVGSTWSQESLMPMVAVALVILFAMVLVLKK